MFSETIHNKTYYFKSNLDNFPSNFWVIKHNAERAGSEYSKVRIFRQSLTNNLLIVKTLISNLLIVKILEE